MSLIQSTQFQDYILFTKHFYYYWYFFISRLYFLRFSVHRNCYFWNFPDYVSLPLLWSMRPCFCYSDGRKSYYPLAIKEIFSELFDAHYLKHKSFVLHCFPKLHPKKINKNYAQNQPKYIRGFVTQKKVTLWK